MEISYIRSPQLFSYLDPKKIIRFFNQIRFSSSSFYEDSLRRRTCVRQTLPAVDHLHVVQVQTMASRLYSFICHKLQVTSYKLQVQNMASRLYRSHGVPADKAVFDGYVSFMGVLCRMFQKYTNVIGVEMFNEPPMGGLWAPTLFPGPGVLNNRSWKGRALPRNFPRGQG